MAFSWSGLIARTFEISPLLIINSLHYSSTATLVQPIQGRHVLFRNVEPKNIRILGDPLRVVALRQRYPTFLQAISDQNLSGRLAVFLRDPDQRLIVGLVIPHEWAIRLNDDLVFLAVFDDLPLLAPRMQLDASQ